jgi:DNA-binding transcriptional MocR family regulator
LHVLAEAVTRWFPAGTEVTRPVGGFVVWVTMPEHVDAMALYDALGYTSVNRRMWRSLAEDR